MGCLCCITFNVKFLFLYILPPFFLTFMHITFHISIFLFPKVILTQINVKIWELLHSSSYYYY